MKPSQLPSSSGSLSMYLSEISQYPLLKAQEEKELARLYRKTGNTHASHLLVVSNLRFVVKIASEFRNYGLKLGDLIQEGNLGLMRAVEKFEPSRDIRLISYAVWWIRAQLQSYILKNWSLVRIGTTQAQRRLFFALARTKRELNRLHGETDQVVDPEEIARVLKVSTRDVQQMERRMSGRDASLDAPLKEGGDASHLDVIEGHEMRQDERCNAKEEEVLRNSRVGEAMDQLDDRERYIVMNRIMADDEQSLKELGDHFGISRERARQLELRAKAKLRVQLESLAEELNIETAHHEQHKAA